MEAHRRPSLGLAGWALVPALLAAASCGQGAGVAPGDRGRSAANYADTCEAGPCDGGVNDAGVEDAGTPDAGTCQNSTQLDAEFRVAEAPLVCAWDSTCASTSAFRGAYRGSSLAAESSTGVVALDDYPPPPPQNNKGCRCPQVQIRCNTPENQTSACSPVECWIRMTPGECKTLGYTDGQVINQNTLTPVVFITYPPPPPPPWPDEFLIKAKCMGRHEGTHACQPLAPGLWCNEKDAFAGDQACVQAGMDALGCGKGPWDIPSPCNDLNNDKTRDGILLAYMGCRCGGKTAAQCLAECKGDGKKPVRNAFCDQIATTYEPQAKAYPKTQSTQ